MTKQNASLRQMINTLKQLRERGFNFVIKGKGDGSIKFIEGLN